MSAWELADRAIQLLTKKAIKRFESAKSDAQVKGFDELEVISSVKTLYQRLAKDNKDTFLDLAQMQYDSAEPKGDKPPDKDWLFDYILEAYEPSTRYQYTHEVDRKRDRLIEAVNSTTNKAAEYKRGLVYWSDMAAEYADITSFEATVKAYRDAGVKYVKWVTADDEKVCEVCGGYHNKIFPIDKIPPKPHWRCRCIVKPLNKV